MVRKDRKSLVDFSNMGDTDFLNAKEQKSAGADEQAFVLDNEQKSVDADKQEPKLTIEHGGKELDIQESENANQQESKNTEEQESKQEKMRRITFNIPESLYKKLKWLSVQEDITMLEIGAVMAKEFIEKRGK